MFGGIHHRCGKKHCGIMIIKEIIERFKSEKSKVLAMGFGIVWSTFVFVLLQGAYRGFYDNRSKALSLDRAEILIMPGQSQGKNVFFKKEAVDLFTRGQKYLKHMAPTFRTKRKIHCDSKAYGPYRIDGINQNYTTIKNLCIESGRLFTKYELNEAVPVCLLDGNTKEMLFGTKQAVGQSVIINNQIIRIVGVFKAERMPGGPTPEPTILIPSTLFESIHLCNKSPEGDMYFSYILAEAPVHIAPTQIADNIRHDLAKLLNVKPSDKEAVYIGDSRDNRYRRDAKLLLRQIHTFVLIVSFCLLISGVLNFGNMLSIVISERSSEIMLRKIMGATNSQIKRSILLETLLIILLHGIVGMIFGKIAITLVNIYLLPKVNYIPMVALQFSNFYFVLDLVFLTIAGFFVGISAVGSVTKIKPVIVLNGRLK